MSQASLTGQLGPTITASDRLGLTLFFAVTIHAIIILGITFGTDLLKDSNPVQTMEITLVQSKSETAPDDDAQFLAQANQQGSGTTEQSERPQAERSEDIKTPHVTKGTAPEHSVPVKPRAQRQEQQQREVMTAQNADQATTSRKQTPREDAKQPTASTLIARSLQIAAQTAEVEQFRVANQNKKRSKFITASTREFKYAAYQQAWRQKVERIGRINYPEEARKRKLSGNLTMTVVLRADGSVYEISIDHSSGNKLLDDAAKRIVRLAAPFAPFPDNIRSETDLLHITRTWIFQDGTSLYAR